MAFVSMIIGLIGGSVVGAVLGFLFALGLGLFVAWTHPDDPSAGSVAIVVIATVPLGFMIGGPLEAGVALYWSSKPDHMGISPELTAQDILHPGRRKAADSTGETPES